MPIDGRFFLKHQYDFTVVYKTLNKLKTDKSAIKSQSVKNIYDNIKRCFKMPG